MRQRSPVSKDLPVASVAFVENNEESRGLDELPVQGIDEHARRAQRHAMRWRIVYPVVHLASLHGLGGPWLIRQAARKSRSEINPPDVTGQRVGSFWRVPLALARDASPRRLSRIVFPDA